MSNSTGYEVIRTLIKFYEIQDENIQERIIDRLIETIAKVCDDQILNSETITTTIPYNMKDFYYSTLANSNISTEK